MKHLRHWRILVLILALLFCFTALAETAIVKSNTKVYKKASTSSQSKKVKKGTEVEMLATKSGWAKVERNGVQAFIKTKYLEIVPVTQAPVETPAPTATPSVTPVTVVRKTKAYQTASASAKSVSVKAGTIVNLIATSGKWALAERNGVQAYMLLSDLSLDASTPAPTATPAIDTDALMQSARPATITVNTYVYQSPSASAKSVKVKKGLNVNLLAVSGNWALVERNGVYAYMSASEVAEEQTVVAPSPTAAPTPSADAVDAYMNSSSYTNEQKCYYYLTRAMGLNTAAACGILANIKRESDFNPECGSTYYGLVQWNGTALSNMRKWAKEHGYASTSIQGQLGWLNVELQRNYPKVYSYLMNVDNSAQGAYDAGYYFCYWFEIPAGRASASTSRGALARDTYFPKYK